MVRPSVSDVLILESVLQLFVYCRVLSLHCHCYCRVSETACSETARRETVRQVDTRTALCCISHVVPQFLFLCTTFSLPCIFRHPLELVPLLLHALHLLFCEA